MQIYRAAGAKTTLLLAIVGMLGCTGAGPPQEETANSGSDLDAAAPGERQDSAQSGPAEKGPEGPVAETTSAPEAAPPNETPCEIISAADANAVPGLQQAGSVGPHRFFAKRRALLCSEPGGGGIGECEIVGATIIRVEGPSGTYGLRSRGDVPALLIYGPKGITCVAPKRR